MKRTINNNVNNINPTIQGDAAPVYPATPAPPIGVSPEVCGLQPNINSNDALIQYMQQQQRDKEAMMREIQRLNEEKMMSDMRNLALMNANYNNYNNIINNPVINNQNNL